MKTTSEGLQQWNEIIFENRNKAYGAYALRKEYHEQVLKGMLIAAACFGIAFISPEKPKIDKGSGLPPIDTTKIIFVDLKVLKPKELPKEKPAVLKKTDVVPTHVTIKEIMEDSVKTSTSDLPVYSNNIVTTDSTSTSTDGEIDVRSNTTNTAKAPDWVVGPEVMPAYEGGFEGMSKDIRNTMRYPSHASRIGQEGTVFVSFVIDTHGMVTLTEVIKGVSTELDNEALRVVSTMQHWKPGMQNKKPVNVKMVLPIKFALNH